MIKLLLTKSHGVSDETPISDLQGYQNPCFAVCKPQVVHCKVARTLVLEFVIPVDSGHVFNGVLFVSAVSVALEASLEEIGLDLTRSTEEEEISYVKHYRNL